MTRRGPMKPEDFRADSKRPFTGAEYLKSLQDSREIYIYGERVKDVCGVPQRGGISRPAVRDAARSGGIACAGIPTQRRLYPQILPLRPQPGRVRQQRDAIADWSPKATAGWGVRRTTRRPSAARWAYPEFYGQFADNAPLVQTHSGNRALFQPRHRQPADRPPQAGQRVKDVYIQVEKRPTPASSSAAPKWWLPTRR